MFNLNGRKSPTAIAAQAAIDFSGLNLDPKNKCSFAITLYRRDPLDRYLYLTAAAGLRETEPMYGPMGWNDSRRNPDPSSLQRHPHEPTDFGFTRREGVNDVRVCAHEKWDLYINPRDGFQGKDEAIIARLDERLKEILESGPLPSGPLFPDLWFQERLARDELRDTVHECAPGTSLEEIAAHTTRCLFRTFNRLLPDATDTSIGIYLDNGEAWQLCGAETMRPILSGLVPRSAKPDENAFTWVGMSTRPVLVHRQTGDDWRNRLEACGPDFASLLGDHGFESLILVPLLYGPQRRKAFGVLALIAKHRCLAPAHVFLLSRLSYTVSGYLHPLLPLPGFPWWPQAKLRRGMASVEIAGDAMPGPTDMPTEVGKLACAVASDLMPYKSKVILKPLRWGNSGAMVFRLDVSDERGITEVSRVLRIGPPDLIQRELKAYYQYAHNKVLGIEARVDIARSSIWPGTNADISQMAAIVYMLVGSGEDAMPWSIWARQASETELNKGLQLLRHQLERWYVRSKEAQGSKTCVELMIGPLANLRSHVEGQLDRPTLDDVKELLQSLPPMSACFKRATTCVAHGDLHAGNLFAILSRDHTINGVALIDWANVASGRHPLSDISRLMVDLAYHVCPSESMRQRCRSIVCDWGTAKDMDWAIALIHQIAKLLFWRQESNERQPYIAGAARSAAWAELQELVALLKSDMSPATSIGTTKNSVAPIKKSAEEDTVS